MKNNRIKLNAFIITAYLSSLFTASAAIIPIANFSSTVNSESIHEENVDSANSSYFLSGKITHTIADPSPADDVILSLLSGSTAECSLGLGLTNTDVFIARTFNNGFQNFSLNGVPTITSGTTIDFILKVDTGMRRATFWLNPDRSKIESDQAGASITNLSDGFTFINVNLIRFHTRGSLTAQTDFTDFNFYTGIDTPFAIVPEPTTYTLIFSSIALAYVMFHRRFKG